MSNSRSRARNRFVRHFGVEGHRCAYCNCPLTVESLTVDHVVPIRRLDMANELANLAPACMACNTAKGNRTPDEYAGVCWRTTKGYIWHFQTAHQRLPEPAELVEWAESSPSYHKLGILLAEVALRLYQERRSPPQVHKHTGLPITADKSAGVALSYRPFTELAPDRPARNNDDPVGRSFRELCRQVRKSELPA